MEEVFYNDLNYHKKLVIFVSEIDHTFLVVYELYYPKA